MKKSNTKYVVFGLIVVALVVVGLIVFSNQETEEEMAPNETLSETANVVNMEGSQFVPGEIQISTGEEVVWVNQDSFAHTVTGFGVDVNIGAGENYTHTFNEAGTFDYECTIHPGMTGTVVVE